MYEIHSKVNENVVEEERGNKEKKVLMFFKEKIRKKGDVYR